MRSIPAALLLAGCSYTPQVAEIDASASKPFCEHDGVVMCLELEGNTSDGTANGLDAAMVNVAFEPGRIGLAARVVIDSAIDVGESSLLDVAELTMEAWILPDSIPATGRRGILDVEGQYGFFLHDGGRLRCTGGGASPTIEAGITAGVWTHVACTVDATKRRIYVNGTMLLEEAATQLDTGGADGASVAGNNPSGDRFLGLIDQVRLWSRGLAPDEVAAAQ